MTPWAIGCRCAVALAITACASTAPPSVVAPPPKATAVPEPQLPAATAPAPTVTPPDPDLVYYREAVPRLRAADPQQLASLDFRRLRRGSMLHGGGTLGDAQLERRLDEAIATGDEARILEATAVVLDDDAAHIRAHVVRDNLLRKRSKAREADFHHAMVTGLLSSLFASGDGKSVATAFRVFHVREEYDLLRLIKADVVSQSLETQSGAAFDVVRVKRPDGRVAEMYFDVTELFALATKSPGGG